MSIYKNQTNKAKSKHYCYDAINTYQQHLRCLPLQGLLQPPQLQSLLPRQADLLLLLQLPRLELAAKVTTFVTSVPLCD